MNRLLIANFARIKKNKLFWVLCGVMALTAIVMVVSFQSQYANRRRDVCVRYPRRNRRGDIHKYIFRHGIRRRHDTQ